MGFTNRKGQQEGYRMNGADADQTANTVAVPEGVDADLLMKVLGNSDVGGLFVMENNVHKIYLKL